MEKYLVGGAVRDELLGYSITDKDWVVVGSSAQELKAQGYQQVGRDFPVFLDPVHGEAHALARTERKTAKGHGGFTTESGPTITLEDDLYRRDLTINAIARDEEHHRLIDPFHGQDDIKNRILRHVSDAFQEDPLRILRVARFAARFHEFRIHDETWSLMMKMVDRDELAELPPERIFSETQKALATGTPHIYFNVLADLRAGDKLWPELAVDHIEGLKKWKSDNQETQDPFQAFVILLAGLPVPDVETVCTRLNVPLKYREMAALASRFLATWSGVSGLSAEEILSALYASDAFRRPQRFVTLCELLSQYTRSQGDMVTDPDPWPGYLDLASQVSASEFAGEFSGAALGRAIKTEQIRRIQNLL